MIRTRIASLFTSVSFNATQRLLGRWSPGKGYGQEIAIGSGLSLANGVLSATGSGAPSGGAGGVLSGSYPNPGFAVDMATQAELNAVADTKVPAPLVRSEAPQDEVPTPIHSTLTYNTNWVFPDFPIGDTLVFYVSQSPGNNKGINWPLGTTWPGGTPGVIDAGTTTRFSVTRTGASAWSGSFVSLVTLPVASNGTPGTIGQSAVVNNSSVYLCTRETPVKWVQLS
jgi:hypothetical protein